MKHEITQIYALLNPVKRDVKYIGRTRQRLSIRLNQHIQIARRNKSKCKRVKWIQSVLKRGKVPVIQSIETVKYEDGPERENYWISQFDNLTNEQSGNVGGENSYSVNWTPERISMLGKISDTELSEMIGVTRKAVAYKRRSLGITAIQISRRAKRPPNMGGWNKIILPDSIIKRLGTSPDYILAAEIGVAKTVIARKRRELGIDSYAKQTGNTGRYKKGNFPRRWLNCA